MKNILILILVCFYTHSFSQKIQIIEKNNNYTPIEKVEAFEFIDKKLNLADHEKIVILKGYSINTAKSTLVTLFNEFWETSNNLGANSYIIDEVERASDTIYVQISAYGLDKTMLDDKFKLYPQNVVYIFGDLDVKKGNIKKIKLNCQNEELAPLEYILSQNEVGKYVAVSIGGFFGAKVDIKGREERLPMYLSLNGFGIGSGIFNQMSIIFNTGRIYTVNMNFGQFLINILNKNNTQLYTSKSKLGVYSGSAPSKKGRFKGICS